MPWILLLLLSLFSAPSLAVTIPGVTTGTATTQESMLNIFTGGRRAVDIVAVAELV